MTNTREYYERAIAMGHYERCSALGAESEYSRYSLTGFGFKHRMHPIAVAIADANLDNLDELNEARYRNAKRLEELVADRGDVHAELEAKELALLIGRFVRGLPERQLYVFIGRYYLAQPLAKIAEELGCGISTVKRELAVIKGKLKEYLEREGYCL